MTRDEFAALHTGPEPLVLYNIWDAGSAQAVARAGARVIATGSLSLAGSQGFDDGEVIPFSRLVETVAGIAQAIRLPVSADMESGFASDPDGISVNAAALYRAGAIGCNLEDQLIGASSLRDPAEQAERIAAVNHAGLFVNARTDVFLGPLMAGENPNTPKLVDEALQRAAVYRDAGAGCLFAPGLSDRDLIANLAKNAAMPINIMRLPGMMTNAELGKLGVARISYGPAPWREAMEALTQKAQVAFASDPPGTFLN